MSAFGVRRTLLILREFSTFHPGYPHAYPLAELVAPAAFQRRN